MYFSMNMMYFNKMCIYKFKDKALNSMVYKTGLIPELMAYHHVPIITASEELMYF